MSNIQRINTAVAKEMFSRLTEEVQRTGKPIIVQRNNIDRVAIVPLGMLPKLKLARKRWRNPIVPTEKRPSGKIGRVVLKNDVGA